MTALDKLGGPLVGLSLQATRRGRGATVPPVLTNDERVRAFRAFQPVHFGNAALTDSIRAAQYAREAMADAEPTTDVHWRDK